ncbi:MAG: hypothetical protein R2856_32765 [Caldilineaceae bacterium]
MLATLNLFGRDSMRLMIPENYAAKPLRIAGKGQVYGRTKRQILGQVGRQETNIVQFIHDGG